MRKIRRVFILFSVGILIAFGQNCSQVDFGQAQGFSSKATDDGSTFVEDPVDGTPSSYDDQDAVRDEEWLSANCSLGILNHFLGILPSNSSSGLAQDRTIQSFRGPLVVDLAANLILLDVHGPIIIKQAGSLKAQHIRGPIQLKAGEVSSMEDIQGPLMADTGVFRSLLDHRGPACISASSTDEIRNFQGPLRYLGPSQGGSIGSIQNSRGPLYLENVHVGKIENHHGPIFLRNSRVDQLIDIQGPLIQQ